MLVVNCYYFISMGIEPTTFLPFPSLPFSLNHPAHLISPDSYLRLFCIDMDFRLTTYIFSDKSKSQDALVGVCSSFSSRDIFASNHRETFIQKLCYGNNWWSLLLRLIACTTFLFLCK